MNLTSKEVKYIDELSRIISTYDTEVAHIMADDLLVKVLRNELRYKALAAMYEGFDKWYA